MIKVTVILSSIIATDLMKTNEEANKSNVHKALYGYSKWTSHFRPIVYKQLHLLPLPVIHLQGKVNLDYFP